MFNLVFKFVKPKRFLKIKNINFLVAETTLLFHKSGSTVRKKTPYKNNFFFFLNFGLRLVFLALNTPPVIQVQKNILLDSTVASVVILNKTAVAISAGTFTRVYKKNKFFLLMPSGVLFLFLFSLMGFIGRNSPRNFISTKFSKYFYKRKNISVRGCAKNAVDHANGGSGRGGIPRSGSPWLLRIVV